MDSYVKAIMYAYPYLEYMEKEYAQHIENKAVLSYAGDQNVERLAEYIVGQVIEKEKIGKLKTLADQVWETLTDVEKTLVAIRYFGAEKKIKRATRATGAGTFRVDEIRERLKTAFSNERNYFRRQQRLLKRLAATFRNLGLTEAAFLSEFGDVAFLRKVFETVKEGKDARLQLNEKRWLGRERK
ncbi:MAG: hypothetical protein IJB97_06250 [Clostridia bacterium]|nr:hypothetical protein [Clostridia bacterium]